MVPANKPKRGRLWLTDRSCIRLRAEHRNHVWSYDFLEDRTYDGRKYRMLNIVDEFTHECLAIRIARRLKAVDFIELLSDLFILRGVPAHIRSDNGPELIASAVRGGLLPSVPRQSASRPPRQRSGRDDRPRRSTQAGSQHHYCPLASRSTG